MPFSPAEPTPFQATQAQRGFSPQNPYRTQDKQSNRPYPTSNFAPQVYPAQPPLTPTVNRLQENLNALQNKVQQHIDNSNAGYPAEEEQNIIQEIRALINQIDESHKSLKDQAYSLWDLIIDMRN